MTTVKERIESALGTEMRVFGSKYFAYDENTLKAAQELGIEYVLARELQVPKQRYKTR
jgi:cytosine/adenosine deaminase-related metal-dependent hydrolase